MNLMVLGARGMLGTDVMLAAENAGHAVRGFGHQDLDITDEAAVVRRIEREKPDTVINCAAWTDVDGAEDDPEGANLVNGTAAGIVARAAASVGAKVVYVSSDYVFDGTKTSPYVETDQVGPIGVYGQSKLAGEVATASGNPRCFIVRSSWLFGVNGPNFVDTMLRLGKNHGEVLVVRDQVGSPTYTWHLAYGIIRLIDTGAYGVHHMAASGSCSWYEFAKAIFEKSKLEVRTLSATTEDFGRKAPRPAYSVMVSASEDAIVLPTWQEGLDAFLAQRAASEQNGASA
jgi:dTDP-4-dehydrorhamnose reductase